MSSDVSFYGYKHWTLEVSPRCFYVGKGVERRPHSRQRNHKWHAIVERFGLRVEVCVGPVTNEEACAWEIEQIAQERTFSTCYHHNADDIGCNFTQGGEGARRPKSAEEREKIRVSKLGVNLRPETLKKRSDALTGQRRTSEVRRKFSELKKQYHAEHPDSEETRRLKSEAAKRHWQDPEFRRKQLETRAKKKLPSEHLRTRV